jgi:hypothetical protein
MALDFSIVLRFQEALEPAFQDRADRAREAGWGEDEIALALLELAGAHVKARAANYETEKAIARAKAEHAASRDRGSQLATRT